MKSIHEEAQVALAKARDEIKRYADLHCGEAPNYKVGDLVMLEMDDLDLKRPSQKFGEVAVGPYPIIEIMSSNAVKLKFSPSIKLSPIVNISRLRPYHQPSPLQTITPPPPVEIEGELEYNVEQILDL